MKRAIITILAVLSIDQILKIWVKMSMPLSVTHGEHSDIIPGVIELFFIENRGMAFGLMMQEDWFKIGLSLFRVVAVFGIGWYLRKLLRQNAHRGLIICVAMIMAGAIGNIIDSAVYGLIFSESTYAAPAVFMPEGGGYASFLMGNVVDMLHFTTRVPEWFPFVEGTPEVFSPIFNLADAAISVGVTIIILFQKRFFPRKEDGASQEVEEAVSV